MKKLLLLVVALLTVFTLSACDGLEEKYPVEGEETFTLSDVEAMMDEKFTDYGLGINGAEDFLDAFDDLEDEVEWQQMLIDEQADMLWIMLEMADLLKDQSVIEREMFHEEGRSQFEELYEAYHIYLIEEYPDYFDETSFEFEQETYTYTFEGITANVKYTSYAQVIVIEEIEMCGEICEISDFNQTDYVITIEELQLGIQEMVHELYALIN